MSPRCSVASNRNRIWLIANRTTSRAVKYLRAASPRNIQYREAPCIIVLSTSKNAAASGSPGTDSAASSSAVAQPASTSCRLVPVTAAPCEVEDPTSCEGSRPGKDRQRSVPGAVRWQRTQRVRPARGRAVDGRAQRRATGGDQRQQVQRLLCTRAVRAADGAQQVGQG